MSGTLYIVGTPIGNLGDITLRAVETLKSVDRVYAEDTRRTRGLLSHLGIGGKPLGALDAHASDEQLNKVVEHLSQGASVAFVSDAGMPSVSDPGTPLVERAAAAGIRVLVVPGPSAVTAAVSLSGLVDARFLFLGFLPRRGAERRRLLERVRDSVEPCVVFEAKGRLQSLLDELAALIPGRRASVSRELTKLHEETLRASLAELSGASIDSRGEVVLVIAGNDQAPSAAFDLDAEIRARLERGDSVKTIAAALHAIGAGKKRELYERALELSRGSGPAKPE